MKPSILLAVAALAVAQPTVSPPDRFFDSAGVRLRYVEQGEGPAVVLMHGYTGTVERHWLGNGVFAALARDHRVIAFDLRGHGKSGKPHEPAAYGEVMAGDVVRLLDHLAIRRAHVVGYSLGAIVAGRLATLHPDRLISVAYVAQVPMRTITPEFARFARESIEELEGDIPFRSLVVALQPPGATPPADAEIRALVAPLAAANDVKALAALWRGYGSLLAPDAALRASGVPTMVLIGGQDQVAAQVPALVQEHPTIRALVVAGAEHGGERGVMRRPEFMAALREFLAGAR
jgi:pimeloyl-ACP methyl ester carboxylesterase